MNLPDWDGPESYRMWADLRNFLLQLVQAPPARLLPSPTKVLFANPVLLEREPVQVG